MSISGTSGKSVNLTVPVPLLGGVVGGTFDGMACYMTSQATDRAFRPTAAEHGLEAKIETAVSALEARTTQLEALLIQWRIGTVLAGTTVTAVMTGMVMGWHTLTQDFHFGPGTVKVYTRAAPNTTSFRAEPCT